MQQWATLIAVMIDLHRCPDFSRPPFGHAAVERAEHKMLHTVLI
jgi:hypothetical protein